MLAGLLYDQFSGFIEAEWPATGDVASRMVPLGARKATVLALVSFSILLG